MGNHAFSLPSGFKACVHGMIKSTGLSCCLGLDCKILVRD